MCIAALFIIINIYIFSNKNNNTVCQYNKEKYTNNIQGFNYYDIAKYTDIRNIGGIRYAGILRYPYGVNLSL